MTSVITQLIFHTGNGSNSRLTSIDVHFPLWIFRHNADLLEVFRMYRGLSVTPFNQFFVTSLLTNTRSYSKDPEGQMQPWCETLFLLGEGHRQMESAATGRYRLYLGIAPGWVYYFRPTIAAFPITGTNPYSWTLTDPRLTYQYVGTLTMPCTGIPSSKQAST